LQVRIKLSVSLSLQIRNAPSSYKTERVHSEASPFYLRATFDQK